MYWLLGHCCFAAAGKCVYAHDATYLPVRGWWTDIARLERMRSEFDAAVNEEPLDLGDGQVEERILAEAFVPLPWRKDLWAVALYDGDAYGLGSDEDDEDEYEYGYGYDEEDAFYDEERRELSEFGIANADVEEMWEYGIKLWEDDAYVRGSLFCEIFRCVADMIVADFQEEMLSIRHALSRLY